MNRFALIVGAGLASVALAQTAEISYLVNGTEDAAGFAFQENTTYSVSVQVSFAGGEENLLSTSYNAVIAGALADIGNFQLDADHQSQGSVVAWDGSSLEVLAVGPTNLFAPAAGSPQTIFSFDLTTGSAGEITLNTASWDIQVFSPTFAISEHTLTNGAQTWTVVPTPGALAIAGLGGLVAVRRRRA